MLNAQLASFLKLQGLLYVLIVQQGFLLIQEAQAVLANLVKDTFGTGATTGCVKIVRVIHTKMKLDRDPVENATLLLHSDLLVQRLVVV